MFDWKVLVAGIAALVLVGFVAVGDIGFGFFSGVADRIGEFFSGAPLGGLFPSQAEQEEVSVIIYPENVSIELEKDPVSINSVSLSSFTGTLEVDFVEDTISLVQEDSDLRISTALQDAAVEGAVIKNIVFEAVRLEILSGKYTTTSHEGTIEISDFSGNITIDSDSIRFEGNASKVDRR